MQSATALQFSYSSVPHDIVCAPDAISGLGHAVDQLGARTAMVVCGPSILRSADVIPRVQHALGKRYAGLFAGVAPMRQCIL